MSTSLEREIERRRRRATDLGVDRLICGLYYDRGLCYYLSWSKNPEYVYRCISQASELESGRLDFTMNGQNYSIRTKHGTAYHDDEDLIELELWENEQLVFSQDVGRISGPYDDMYVPRRTTGFIEGPWIAHFRGLENEAKAAEKLSRLEKLLGDAMRYRNIFAHGKITEKRPVAARVRRKRERLPSNVAIRSGRRSAFCPGLEISPPLCSSRRLKDEKKVLKPTCLVALSAMSAPAVVAPRPATAPSSRRAQHSMPNPGAVPPQR